MKINHFEYSIGNTKIGRDTLIFNMGSADRCPSRDLGLCTQCDNCYADQAELQYPRCLPFRNRQEVYWRGTSLSQKFVDFKVCFDKHVRTIKFARFSESGDFWEQQNVDDIQALAEDNPTTGFYGYTARKDLDYSKQRPDNYVINGSGFMIDNEFRVLPKGSKVMCKADCRKCDLCKVARGLVITVEEH